MASAEPITTTTTGKISCAACGKEKVSYKCGGCSLDFCYNHLGEHRQLLIRQLDQIEDERNLLHQTMLEQTANSDRQPLMQEVDQWEQESIRRIQQTAAETRQMLSEQNAGHFREVQMKLTKLTEELRQTRAEEDVNEIHLNRLGRQLKELEEQMKKQSTVVIQRENSSAFINRISVVISPTSGKSLSEDRKSRRFFLVVVPSYLPNIDRNARWTSNGTTVVGGNGGGFELNQLYYPWSVFVDDDQTIYIADYYNHRIVEWKKGATTGRVVAGGKGAGNGDDQLNGPVNVILDKQNDLLIIADYNNRRVVRWPRQNGTSGETIISNIDCWGLVIDHDGNLYVSDIGQHEVRRWKIGETNGTLVAGGNGQGNRLDQLNQPHYIFIDQYQSIYISDCGNHRVMKWLKGAREGIVLAGNHGSGNALTQLSCPRGLFVDQLETVYVADQNNDRIIRWPKGAAEGTIILGRNGKGRAMNQFNDPLDLSFDQENNLYIVDQSNHRIQKFNIDTVV